MLKAALYLLDRKTAYNAQKQCGTPGSVYHAYTFATRLGLHFSQYAGTELSQPLHRTSDETALGTSSSPPTAALMWRSEATGRLDSWTCGS